jgi:hypothetical protein
MTNDEGKTKFETRQGLREFVGGSFVRHSAFGIRHFTATL